MKKKLRALLNSSSFYAGLALCPLAVGVGGYALFSGGEQTDPAEDAPDVPVTAPVPEEVELTIQTPETEPVPLRYQITDGCLDRWTYSPPNYEKEPVETVFQ